MRVLHLANSVSNLGNGIVNVAVDLALGQAALGHTVAFASGGGGYEPLLTAGGVECISAPQMGAARALPNSLHLLSLLRRFRPDIVHTHMRNGLVLVAPWAKLLRIPLVMHVHNIHDRDYGMTRLPHRVLAVSQSVAATLIAQGTPAARVRVVLNGMLGSPRLPDSDAQASLEHPAVVTVAGMMHRKGIAELIEAFDKVAANFPAAHLYLVGSGSERENFEAQANRSAAAQRIHFVGFQADPRPFLRASDLFVLASRRESFGLAIVEARAAGCAIVASDVDGIPELLEGGGCGVLSPPNDPPALAAAMERLLADEILRKQLALAATRNLEPFTVGTMTENVLAIYSELLSRR